MLNTSSTNLSLIHLAKKGAYPVEIRSPHQAHELTRAILHANPTHEPTDYFCIWLDDDNRMIAFTHLPLVICPLHCIRHPDIMTTWRQIKSLKPDSCILVLQHTGDNPKPSREEFRMYRDYWLDMYAKALYPIDLLILAIEDRYWSLAEAVAAFYEDEEDFRYKSDLYTP